MASASNIAPTDVSTASLTNNNNNNNNNNTTLRGNTTEHLLSPAPVSILLKLWKLGVAALLQECPIHTPKEHVAKVPSTLFLGLLVPANTTGQVAL